MIQRIKLTTTTFIILLGFISLSLNQCPITTYQPDIYINSLTITNENLSPSSNSNITISQQQQVKTYSHLLLKPFNKQPQITTTISDFTAQYSLNLFLSVKPYFVGDGVRRLNSLNFVIRTEWKYSVWKKIKFSFIAEERSDIQVGIYQIETNVLDSYEQNKQLQLYFPYYTSFKDSPTVTTFLTGFQISSKQNNTYNSPIQIQQRLLSRNLTGFSLSLSVTSNTLVSELVISYVAYDSRLLTKVIGSTLVYEDYLAQSAITKNIASTVVRDLREVFYGLNGFILVLKENADILFETNFAPGTKDFTWTSSSSMLYLAYSYLALIGSRCSLCEGYPYFYLTGCLSTCPVGTFTLNDTCLSCPSGTSWNGSLCITVCSGGRSWNTVSQACQCPLNTFWTGSLCSTCPQGQFLNSLGQCQCISGNWNGTNCLQCQANQVWNTLSLRCECQLGSYWNGISCIGCTNGRAWDLTSLRCVCSSGWNYDQQKCVFCSGGTTWNQTTLTCQCQLGTAWNGSVCQTICPNTQLWNSFTSKCQCPHSSNWNGSQCIYCNSNQLFNQTTSKCQCFAGYYDAGNSNCLLVTYCSGGRIYNAVSKICECQKSNVWDGTKCVSCPMNSVWSDSLKSCVCSETNKLYNSTTNSCLCNNNFRTQLNGSCTLKCLDNQVFNGTQCVSICPIGSYYNSTACITYTPQCPIGTQWSVYQCVSIVSKCPTGMTWTGKCCISQQTKCLQGYFYWNGTSCALLSQRCPYQLEWRNNMCLPTTNNCPSGSYFNGYLCIFYDQCDSNMIWNSTLVKCVCVDGSFWNGIKCVKCDYGMVYTADGCACPIGTVFNGTNCVLSSEVYCKSVTSASWNGTHCVCFPGYSAINENCVCLGLQMTSWCNRCYQKPNSFYQNGICVCQQGYIQYNNSCIKPQQIPVSSPSVTQSTCPVGTFWQSQLKQCLPCSDGCLSCINCYKCLQCEVGFVYNPATQLCEQVCGDGQRFKLQCDDGNNLNGDGCSLDCKIQPDYTCTGGSPNYRDTCTQYTPTEISFTQTGQSHLFGKIVLNIRVNYLPTNLTYTLLSCQKSCLSLLNTTVTQSSQAPSILSRYIGGAYQSISIEIDFKKQPIEKFTIDIFLNPQIKLKYLPAISAGNGLKITVEPMFLTLVEKKDYIR